MLTFSRSSSYNPQHLEFFAKSPTPVPYTLTDLKFASFSALNSKLCFTVEDACRRRRGGGGFWVNYRGGVRAAIREERAEETWNSDANVEPLTCVMKFGGSSVANADRMKEVADLILSFPEERPIIVLSAMGKTTNNLLLVTQD